MARRKLDEFPKTAISWCHVPEVVEDYPECDVAECSETPGYEIYFDDDRDHYWYYMCETHKDHFARRKR